MEAIRTTTADKVNLPHVHIHKDMEDYAGWGWQEHLRWVSELTGLNRAELILAAGDGYHIITDDDVSEVWMLSNDYYKTTARLLYDDSSDCVDRR
jgi:hypothetical protein